MKRRVAGFLLTLAASGGCMNSQGEFGHMGMQQSGGPIRLASSEQGGPMGPYGVPMTAQGGMGPMMGGAPGCVTRLRSCRPVTSRMAIAC